MKKLTTGVLAATMAALLLAGAAIAAVPTVSITSPANGTTVSRSATPTLALAGGVSFDTPAPTSTRFFLRRAACGGTADPGMRLSITNGTDGGTGCGYIGGWNALGTADEEGFAMDFPAADGLPFTLDASRPLTARISMDSYRGIVGNPVAIAAGTANLKITVTGSTASGSVALGTQTLTKQVLPTTGLQTYDFSIPMPASQDKKDFTSLNLHMTMTGPGVGHGYVNHSGASYMDMPTYSASFDRRVQVAVDTGSFSSTGITVAPDFSTWTGSITTPSAGFAHAIKARAIQGGVTSAVTEISVTVTA